MDKLQITQMIANRVARELKDGDVVNLGIGIPTEVVNQLPAGIKIVIHSENGIVGVGEAPLEENRNPDLINAGGGFVSEVPETSYLDSATSFALVRGGHLDIAILGALQVDQKGDIANWMIPGKFVPGIGGAMDLCAGTKVVAVTMTHLDKNGKSKILKKCTLPLTAKGKVTIIVTDMAFMRITDKGLVLEEVAQGYTVDDVVAATEADLIIPETVGSFGL